MGEKDGVFAPRCRYILTDPTISVRFPACIASSPGRCVLVLARESVVRFARLRPYLFKKGYKIICEFQ